jgi:UDP-N-acetylmuramoyl-tripeptide--D-alanyl-D-alanine ligase
MENLLVVGITGSYGKTSTKEFLSTILSSKYNVLKTREHQNSEVGISKCILNDLKEEHEVFVCEMGAYNKGGIKMLSDIVHPQIGVLTGINQQHMSTFGSQENITKTKFELIESLPKNGLAVLNGDNKIIKEEYNKRNFKVKKRFLYSIKEKLDFFAEDIKEDSFRVSSKKGESALFNIKVPGNFNILNILASVAVSNHLGISLKEISKNSLGINFEKAGTKIEKRGEFNIIDATYSSNPDGIISHLEFLKTFQGNKALIMPCLIELGKSSKEVHQKIGKKIGEVCDLAIITTKERIEEIKKGSELSLNKKTKEIIFLKDGFSIKNKLKEFSIKTILLESRIPKGIIKDIFKL